MLHHISPFGGDAVSHATSIVLASATGRHDGIRPATPPIEATFSESKTWDQRSKEVSHAPTESGEGDRPGA
jgi:hypothetical protein